MKWVNYLICKLCGDEVGKKARLEVTPSVQSPVLLPPAVGFSSLPPDAQILTCPHRCQAGSVLLSVEDLVTSSRGGPFYCQKAVVIFFSTKAVFFLLY